MKVAIVILNWNGRAMLQQYLPSVVRYSQAEAEVIVADNASTDDSLQWLAENFPTSEPSYSTRTMGLQVATILH